MEKIPAYAEKWCDGSDTDRDSVRRMFERDKDDLRAFATKEDFSILRVEMAEGFGRLRGDMAAQHAEMMKWMFVFWVGQAFVVLAYFRIGQYVAAR